MTHDLVVIHDDREKHPLLFPRVLYWKPRDRTYVWSVSWDSERLDTADYYIKGHKKKTVVERKASVNELVTNLFGPARKQRNFQLCLDRMAKEHEFPFLFLDFRWRDIYRGKRHATGPTKYVREQPCDIFDRLMQECNVRGIEMIGPIQARTPHERMYAGDWILRKMLSVIYPMMTNNEKPGEVITP